VFQFFWSVINEDSWKKTKNLYLAIQLGSHDSPDRFDDNKKKEWKKLNKDFFQLIGSGIQKDSSAKKYIHEFRVKTILQDLEAHSNCKELSQMKYDDEIINLKLTHSIIVSVIEHFTEMSPKEDRLRMADMVTSSNIKALDNAVRSLADELQIAYQNYGQMTHELSIENLNQEEAVPVKKTYINDIVYLSRMTRKKESSHDPNGSGNSVLNSSIASKLYIKSQMLKKFCHDLQSQDESLLWKCAELKRYLDNPTYYW
jgi:hypothetical protein